MTEEIVLHERRGNAFWITLNRPEKRNAINNEVIAGISAGIKAAEADPDVRCIVLTGSGEKAFCAGGDLQPGAGFAFDFAQPRTPYGNLIRQTQDCLLPTLAVVNGHCLAGGMGLVSMVDLAISVDTAKFGLPEARVGVFPMQVMALMKTIVPPRVLREWMLCAEPFSAEAAMQAGVLNRVVPASDLAATTEAMIASLSKGAPTALRRGKYALRTIESMTFDQAISFAEGQLGLLSLTQDAQEGLAAFNEKRAPDFKGT